MKANESILAERERAPGWFARYRFYTAGKVPRGHEEWARSRLSWSRFVLVYWTMDAVAWLLIGLITLAVSGGFVNPWGTWVILAAAILFAPLSAAYYRNKARRALAPPPAHAVLKQIGELPGP